MKVAPKNRLNFAKLAKIIDSIHHHFFQKSVKAININLTIRNWLFGWYIVEYEQNGEDRAKYGKNLISILSKNISIKGISTTSLKLSRQFYLTYPQISQTVSDKSSDYPIEPKVLLDHLSFSHFTELVKISDNYKRKFYEFECIKSIWSVRELQRQINSLYFERTGLSRDKKELILENRQKSIQQKTKEIIKDPILFEFLGLDKYQKLHESDLENELISNLQSFIMKMGNGFCFEARQKRIIIGGEYFYIDLVFYHRILKCHILIELKVDNFKHEYLGQLNSYVAYFKKMITEKENNPPVGILLCTNKTKLWLNLPKIVLVINFL